MQELDTIAKTTSFNNQKLLSGAFTNKKFQTGAYAGETTNITINSAEANKIGHVTTSTLSLKDGEAGTVDLSITTTTMAEGSTLAENSTLAAGWSTSQELDGNTFSNSSIATTTESTFGAGSVIVKDSKLGANSDITGSVQIAATNTTTGESTIARGSIL